ncbi:DUF6056 family protein [Gallintestinimicrobium sp.]|uniref:DUF6056 family protein n=1 Tax=Gallintestinimicrobium sp. TaxID=2981655 RepID=UPI0039942D66
MMKRNVNIHTKKIAIFTGIVFLVSLIPILYLSGYVHATGDDYGYGARTHQMWLSTHSVWQVLKAAGQTVQHYWIGWQGTWFTIFLMSLQPEVFWDNGYWIVPWIMLALTIFSTLYLTEYVMVQKLRLPKATWISCTLILLLAMIQYFPSTKSGIFWYNGTAHYIIPYSMALVAIRCCWSFADRKRKKDWIAAFICMALLGGASYLAPLLVLIAVAYLILCEWKTKKHVFYLCIPVAAELAGLIVSYLAPGNKSRGGEDFGIHGLLIVKTILECFVDGAKQIFLYLFKTPFILLCLVVIAVLLVNAFQKVRPTFDFPYPVIVAVAMFCMYCAMYAPGVYAGVELSGGVPNTIYQVFLMTVFITVIYTVGWMNHHFCKDEKMGKIKKAVCGGLLMLALFLILVEKGTLKSSTSYQCYDYIVSGQADDYKAQMEERLSLLRNPELKNVELPAMNSDQGPLMHMEVMEDPKEWTNTVVKQFFGKESVIEVPRSER